MSTFKVTATSLNMRSGAKVSGSNKIAVLAHGQVVNRINKDHAPWWFISTEHHGILIEGYVHSKYLKAASEFQPSAMVSGIVPVHLKENRTKVKRSLDGRRAYPLGEPDRPQRTGSTRNERVSQIGKIIEWLDVEQSKRYIKTGTATFCNIYAHDFCYLAGAYIPRVWWKEKALLELAQGNSVEIRYKATVKELDANSLHDWFEDFGADFGWRSSIDINECQQEANKGKIVLVSAKRVSTNQSGHICPFVPETESHQARRKTNGEISRPLQSQAGGSNFRYKAVNKWWVNKKFQTFGFWIHD